MRLAQATIKSLLALDLLGAVVRKFSIAIILLAFAFASPAKADWWQAETAHFVVKSRASEKDAREYALEMEKFDAALRVMFGLPIDTVESLSLIHI